MNEFIDRHSILDLDCEQAMAAGKSFWVLQPDQTPMPWSGRFRGERGLLASDAARMIAATGTALTAIAQPNWGPALRRFFRALPGSNAR